MSDLSEDFRSLVEKFHNIMGDNLIFMTIFTPDGISLYSSLPSSDTMEDFLLASGSSVLEISKALLDNLDIGGVRRCEIIGERATVLLAPIGKDVYVGLGAKDLDPVRKELSDLLKELEVFFGTKQ